MNDNSADHHRDLTACELVAGLKSGRWTSEQLVTRFLADINTLDSATHAVAIRFDDEALAEARELDRKRGAGESLGPLQGLPLTIKDAFRIEGRRSTYGLAHYKRYRPRSDSEVIRTLREAGAIIIGRTAVPTGSFDWNCRNQVYAECLNPRDRERTPGGSSGGSAAAVAIGLTPLELGSDIAGSIRYPAHCCGVFGFRTSAGWLPSGDFAPERTPPAFERLVVCGPLARSLDDLDLMLKVFAEKFPLPSRTKPAATMRRVAFTDSVLVDCDQATSTVMRSLREALRSRGYEVHDDRPDLDYEALYRDWCLMVGYEYVHSLPKWLVLRAAKKLALDLLLLRKLGKGVLRAGVLAGASLSRADYEQALERRQLVLDTVDTFFQRYDAWVLPCSPAPAIPLKECGGQVTTAGGPVDYSRFLGAYMIPTTVMGTPAAALPVGTDARGLPINVQVHGPRFGDLDLLRDLASWPITTRVAPIVATAQ
ncbi:MAG TPA: amidase family protein [Kofleriaceae bacterium]|jgi:amidase|nr:amidase family protein [Kofleriaceae bacterium]